MVASSSTAEINTLSHLEQVVQQAGSQIVVVAFYSRVSIHYRRYSQLAPSRSGSNIVTCGKGRGRLLADFLSVCFEYLHLI